jgi:hypothetical protein
MQTTTAAIPARNTLSSIQPWLILLSRSVLFIVFQALIAVIAFAAGTDSAWDESTRWWIFTATLTNFVSIFLLMRFYHSEGRRFFDLFKFSRATWKADLLWFIVASIVALPIVAVPREPLAIALLGDVTIANNLLFKPLPTWAIIAGFLFPLTIAFAELPTYFSYVMPRLESQLKNGWLAWFITSFFLAAQHMFLPLIFDGGYLLWRFGMFLPFALFAGFVLKLRPALLPYFVIVHALLDITTVLVYLMI